MTVPLLNSFVAPPSQQLAQSNYRRLAKNYDATCGRIEKLRLTAINTLDLKLGEVIFDIACGTGPALPELAKRVGPTGRVMGVELSEEMALQAGQRIIDTDISENTQVVQTAVTDFATNLHADAVLMCYTHDVLQSPLSLDRLLLTCKPGARIAILGMKTLPWLWGWPVNAVNLYRARHYMTTFASLDRPWRLLEQRGAKITMLQTALMGSAYIAMGTLP